jgi:hypothetical protein
MAGFYPRNKVLTYRDQGGASLEAHAAHWKDFTFEGGPWIVVYAGAWGQVKVWAASESEGRRVVEHACSIASIPLTGEGAGEWIVKKAKDGRNGKGGTFAVAMPDGIPWVTQRQGPSGVAQLADLL